MGTHSLEGYQVELKNAGSGLLVLIIKGGHVIHKHLITADEILKAEIEYVKEAQENRSAM